MSLLKQIIESIEDFIEWINESPVKIIVVLVVLGCVFGAGYALRWKQVGYNCVMDQIVEYKAIVQDQREIIAEQNLTLKQQNRNKTQKMLESGKYKGKSR